MEAIRKPVGELLDAVPRQPKIKRSAYQESGRYPIVDQSQADIAGYTDDESWLYQGELPVVIFGDHTRVLKFVDFPFCVGADGTQLLRPVAGNDIRYFYYALRNVEYVLWVAADSFLTADRPSSWTIRDFWQMRDGDFVTVTNRSADLPGWFELHPLEVAGSTVTEMQKGLEAGCRPGGIMDGPNLWRVKAGDRLVWVTVADSARAVKELLDLRACALVLGETSKPTSDGILAFGEPEGEALPAAAAAAMRTGFDVAVGLGVPREFAPEWRFGA